MPFGPYKSHTDCYNKNKHKMEDAHAFCSWLEKKIRGGDPLVELFLDNERALIAIFRGESILKLSPLTTRHASAILADPSKIRKDPDATVIDDHRWIHMWAVTLKRKHKLFLTKDQLQKLHEIYVKEFQRRGFNHKSPLEVEQAPIMKMEDDKLGEILKNRKEFLVDPGFICYVGSSISNKAEPADIDVLFKARKNEDYKGRYLESMPEELREGQDMVWEPQGPAGPYIEGYELWALPKKDVTVKEPKFRISPMSPFMPAMAARVIDQEDVRDLLEDSYYVVNFRGHRITIHRQESEVIAFDEDLDEYEIPDAITEELLSIKEPTTFILDGFLVKKDDESIFRMFDMPWWRDSEHTRQTAEARHFFINKLPESEHVKMAPTYYFGGRRDAIDFLKDEKGPYLLIPGSTLYPLLEDNTEWMIYDSSEMELAEGSDEQIRNLVNSGKWEGMGADARFRLMTKRKAVEPLYPYAQMKTTKKGYSAREVFGLKSVKDLAKELFKVPSKQAVEVKIDGFRVQVHKKGSDVRIFTESGHEITKQLPKIVADMKKLPAKDLVFDAEATPYDESMTNLGRAGAAPAFAKGAKGPVDDSLWAIHVFDVLYINGEDLHNLPYQERRKRLRGVELDIRDSPKSKADFRNHFWENHVHWATSAEMMIKLAEQVSKVSGSEGAMFKQADSKYRLTGNTPLWSKMKVSFEIDAMVVGSTQSDSSYSYICAIGPVQAEAEESAPLDTAKGKKFVKYKGKVYSVIGKTFNTKQKAKLGDIIRVSVKDIRKIDEGVYHWFHPQVLEVREDKTKPDPLRTAQTISETVGAKQKKAAYLISARYGSESPLACCISPWVAVQGEDGWNYLQNDEKLYETLKGLEIEVIVGTRMEREIFEKLVDEGFDFEISRGPAILDAQYRPIIMAEPDLPKEVTVDYLELADFYSSIRSKSDIPHMKTSCCAAVPLKPIKKLADVYMIYPDENKTWKYVVQFHVRGLSVHADFRAEISKKQLIGWTWDLGKSLIKPMLRRVSPKNLSQVGLTKAQIKDMTISEVSAKLKSTPEGRKLRKELSKKTQDLSKGQLKTLLNELWTEEVDPILKDPNRKILTQRKAPEPHEWLTYEGEVPAGAVGATAELEGNFAIMDKGTIEFGAQKPWFHEYWVKGDRLKGRFIARRLGTRPKWKVKEAFAWMTFFTKPGQLPYTLSRRAVSQKWVPPKGKSAIPVTVRSQIPKQFQYWKAKNNREVRDALVKAIKKKEIPIKLATGLKFAVKRVWHKGPEVKRGMPIVRYWLLIHDGKKVHDAWNFGKDSDPLEETTLQARREEGAAFKDLLPTTGEIPAGHPASYTKKLPNQFDTSDEGSAQVLSDTNNMLRVRFKGGVLKGLYVFLKRDPGSDMWVFSKSELPEPKKAMLLAGLEEGSSVIHLAPADMKAEVVGDLLIVSGAAIKPGEVIPMDGKPTYFTKEGIEIIWKTMYRQPIVVLHGDLKGDVIGFIDELHYDPATGWGHIDRGVIWHPVGIKLILEKKLPAFSIEVLPETVWDAEHKHEHVVGGKGVGVACVPVGACKTCTIEVAKPGSIRVTPGQVYKFGMTTEQYMGHLYWDLRMSTQEISDNTGIPRSTIESWMNNANIPRRDYKEARKLRALKEEQVRKYGGRVTITALGTSAFTDIPRDDCPQCKEARAGGKSKRNYTATLFSIGNEHVLINAPKGIAGMLGIKRVKPQYVLIEHIHEDVVGGLHELRALKPNVFATADAWKYIRRHHRALSGQKGSFEEIYDFPRYVIKDKAFMLGKDSASFVVGPVKVAHGKPGDPKALGFKLNLGGSIVWHCSDVLSIPNHKDVLDDVDIYIGDGASLTRGIKQKSDSTTIGHASMEEQIKWAQEAGVKQIFFTQIGHVGKTHEELNKALKEMAPNAQALFDGAEFGVGGKNPGAVHPKKVAERIAEGKETIIVRGKPYSEYAKQTIFLIAEDEIHGLYVEGFPDGPYKADTVKAEMREKHGLSDEEWEEQLGDAKSVWIYKPRLLKRYPVPRKCEAEHAGPYSHDVRLIE